MTSTPINWDLFTNSGAQINPDTQWPGPPPWRDWRRQEQGPEAQKVANEAREAADQAYWQLVEELPEREEATRRRGEVLQLPRTDANQLTDQAERVRLAVNAAIHLRRPLLVSGTPGSGKTSLAHAIAWELRLGPVLHWPITPRSRLIEDGLYQYDALGRLHDSQFAASSEKDKAKRSPEDFPVSNYIALGPVGTAFLPLFQRPRVLLIDELDKSDLQLPNELLNLFEEGEFEIPQLIREAKRPGKKTSASVRTYDPGATASIPTGRVRCHEFPIVVMTSNRERDFPAAFHRRCIRVEMPAPTDQAAFQSLVHKHFEQQNRGKLAEKKNVLAEILAFLETTKEEDRATDQLLNALHLLTLENAAAPTKDQIETLRKVLYKGLRDRDGGPVGG